MRLSRDFPFPLVLDHLHEIFLNSVPRKLRRFSASNPVPPWRLAEEAVFWFFRYHLSLSTVKLGASMLFRHEPEGLVAGLGLPRNRAMIYECKCRSLPYKMTHDDLLRYKSYIEKKREEVRAMHLILTNFLIIAPGFRGPYSTRLDDLSSGGVCASAMSAECLRSFHHEVEDWKLERIQLLDLSNVLVPGLVGFRHVKREVSRVKRQYRSLFS